MARVWRIAGLVLRLVVVPSLAVWLVFALVSQESARDWAVADSPKLLLGLAIYHVALWLFAERMRTTLSLFEIAISRAAAFRIYLQSIVYFFLVPMSVSIEISRYLKIKALQPDLEFKWLAPAVFMDRLIGFCSSVLFAVVLGVMLVPISLDQVTVLSAGAVLAALGAVAVIYAIRRYSEWLSEILHAVFRHPAKTALPIVISLLMQCVTGLGVWLCAEALGVNAPYLNVLFGVAAGNLAMIVPVSLFGGGPSEVAGAAAFLVTGIDSSDAILLVAILYSLKLMAALEGAALEILKGGIEALRFNRK